MRQFIFYENKSNQICKVSNSVSLLACLVLWRRGIYCISTGYKSNISPTYYSIRTAWSFSFSLLMVLVISFIRTSRSQCYYYFFWSGQAFSGKLRTILCLRHTLTSQEWNPAQKHNCWAQKLQVAPILGYAWLPITSYASSSWPHWHCNRGQKIQPIGGFKLKFTLHKSVPNSKCI